MNPFDTPSLVSDLLGPTEARPRQASGPPADPERFNPTNASFNPQLYETSPLSASQIEQDYEANPNRLFNDRPPNLRILHEKPEHRVLVFLKAQGLSNTEIAQRTGYQIAWV